MNLLDFLVLIEPGVLSDLSWGLLFDYLLHHFLLSYAELHRLAAVDEAVSLEYFSPFNVEVLRRMSVVVL